MISFNIRTDHIFNYNRINNNTRNVSFLGNKNCTDVFERQNHKPYTEIISPYNNQAYSLPSDIDLSEPQTIELISKNNKDNLILDYKPQRTEKIHDTKNNKDIEVVVLHSRNEKNPDEFAYHIFSKDLKTEYGHALYSYYDMETLSGMEEISVKSNNKNIEGINRLADKYAIQYCKENDLSAYVFSYPKPKDYKKIYDEGKRFVVPEDGSEQSKFFIEKYNNSNPNEIIKDKPIDTSNWPSLKMVLPMKTVNKYYSEYITDGIEIFNPIGNSCNSSNIYIDLSQPQKFDIISKEKHNLFDCYIDFNPKRTGEIIDKESGEPIDVYILKLHNYEEPDMDAYIFSSKDLQHEYGYVIFDKDYKGYSDNLIKDYPKENIIGERIVVNYLRNYNDERYGGIGKLADKMAVKYCLENNIKPNIISEAENDSYLAHYSRGKRFITPEKGSDVYEFLTKNYETANPNKILKKLWKESKRTGQKINMEDWNEYYFTMFLPKHLVEKYSHE